MTPDLAAVLASDFPTVRAEFERQLSLGLLASWPRSTRIRMLELLLGEDFNRNPRRSEYASSADV